MRLVKIKQSWEMEMWQEERYRHFYGDAEDIQREKVPISDKIWNVCLLLYCFALFSSYLYILSLSPPPTLVFHMKKVRKKFNYLLFTYILANWSLIKFYFLQKIFLFTKFLQKIFYLFFFVITYKNLIIEKKISLLFIIIENVWDEKFKYSKIHYIFVKI